MLILYQTFYTIISANAKLKIEILNLVAFEFWTKTRTRINFELKLFRCLGEKIELSLILVEKIEF